jgi:putative tryptophan/tyrosine transport system ATP-binding protein
MVEISGLCKTFNSRQIDEKVALDGLDLSLETGAFAVVIGSNGAGKSTLLNALAGSVTPDSGRIVIAGEDVTRLPVHLRARRVARVFQDAMLGTAAGMTVAENMLLADLRGQPRRLRPGLDRQRLERYRERLSLLGLGLEDRLDTRIDLLSGGQRQAVSLIMAVSSAPDLLLLDEHTAALDPKTAALVMQATVKAIGATGLTTLMVTHNMQHAIDHGDRVVMLDAGRVRLEIRGPEKAGLTIPDLVQRFTTKSDSLLLTT